MQKREGEGERGGLSSLYLNLIPKVLCYMPLAGVSV